MADDHHPSRPPGFENKHKSSNNENGKIMITAIVCLFFVILVVIALHIYARCVLKRQARRRHAIRQLSMGIMASQAQSGEAQRAGLNPSVIASLPIFMFKEANGVDKNGSIECSVCLSALEEEEMARILPNCKHMFHAQCIDMWLGAHSTCPICRTDAEPRAQLVPAELDVSVQATAPPLESSATAPPLDSINSTVQCSDCAADAVAQSAKISGSSSRLNSFRRMLSKERSERRVQQQICEQRDLERQ